MCDEGHILRMEASHISKALNAIRTKRRVVLTGTPLQNNLVECKSTSSCQSDPDQEVEPLTNKHIGLD